MLSKAFGLIVFLGGLLTAPAASPAAWGDPTGATAPVDAAPALRPDDKPTPEGALPRPLPPPAARSAADSTVQALVAEVSPDSLYAFLEQLTGEVDVDFPWGSEPILSRYSGSRGQDLAAAFLAARFADLGYDVALQYFRFTWNLQSVIVSPDGSGVAVGNAGHILTTTGADAWERSRDGLETVTVVLREVSRIDAARWVVVGNGGFVATSDDGAAGWTVRASGTAERLDGVSVRESGRGWACGRAGTMLATTDGGATWTAQVSGTTAFLYDVDALDDATAIAVGGGGTILRTTDGGASWNTVPAGTTASLQRASFVGDNGWVVGASGTVLATTDRGATWSAQDAGTTETLAAVSFADPWNGWAAGSLSVIRHTTDGGGTWSAQLSPVPGTNLLGVHAVSATEAWITGYTGALLRTRNGGALWEERTDFIRDGWANVVATWPGTTDPASEVLLGGHYDSTSELREALAPGADDNGSGVAATVEAARILRHARYGRTLKFILFCGEEQGLVGATVYAQRAANAGDPIHAFFNLDSVGWNDTALRLFSDDLSGWVGDVAYQSALTYAPGLTTHHYWCDSCNWSDHWPFQQQGFPAIVGIESWIPVPAHHHTTGDTLGLVNLPLVADVTRIAIASAAALAGVDTTAATSAVAPAAATTALRLHAPVPNPCAGATVFAFDLPRRADVRLRIFDVGGRLVRTLEPGPAGAGRRTVAWDGRDARALPVAAGVYFARLEVAGEVRMRAVTVLR